MHVWMHAYMHSACRCVYVHVCLCVTNFTMINACSWDVCIHTVAPTLKERSSELFQRWSQWWNIFVNVQTIRSTSPTPWAMGTIICFTAFCFIQGSECHTSPVPHHGLWDQLSASQLFALYRALNATHHQSHTMCYGTNYLLHSFLLYTGLWMPHITSPTPCMGPIICFTAFCFIQGSECHRPPSSQHY